MNLKSILAIRLGCIAAVLLLAENGQAQVTVSSNPANLATGVSLTAPVVFTFSGPVDTNLTTALFFSASPYAPLPVISVWNNSSNQLSCTPSPAFPATRMIVWSVDGQDPDGGSVSAGGYFTTGTGGGSTGSGTNAITTFGVNKVYVWDQSPAGVLTNQGCIFNANTILASNRTATSITVTLPTAAVSNLFAIPLHPETNNFSAIMVSSNTFEATFPQGTYIIAVNAASSNQTVQVSLPLGMTQPNPPHITSLVAAQTLNAAQSFVLGWETFVGGTSTDYVNVIITGTNGANVWKSPDPTTASALSGTATSITIPANTLKAGSNYLGYVGFYHFIGVSNATYLAQASRSTGTQFPLGTAANSSAALPVVTNYVKSGSTVSFDVLTITGQDLTVVSTNNCSLPLAQWPIIFFTNSPGASVHITDPRPATNRVMFYRVRNGT